MKSDGIKIEKRRPNIPSRIPRIVLKKEVAAFVGGAKPGLNQWIRADSPLVL